LIDASLRNEVPAMTTTPGFNDTPGMTGPPGAPVAARRLYRSRTNRVLAGVCGGIAEYYGADPTAVRLLTAVIAVFTAVVPMLVLYLIAAIVVPERIGGDAPVGTDSTPAVLEPGRGALIFGIGLVAVGLGALANQVFRVDWDVLWPVALIAIGLVVAVAPPRRSRGS
jgi:phage shock protein PspC (stress-responsive transcriptional regulator)